MLDADTVDFDYTATDRTLLFIHSLHLDRHVCISDLPKTEYSDVRI